MNNKAKMFTVFGVLLFFLSVFLFVYKEENNRKPLRFGATYMTMNNPYFEVLDENLREAIEGNGDILISRDPLQNQNKQNDQIQSMIEEGIDVLFLNPVDWKKVSKAVKMCADNDIPIIVIDTNIYNENSMDNIIATITSDNYNAGVQCALDMMKKKNEAKIVIINHTNINSTKLRVEGFLDTISNYPQYQVVENRDSTAELELAMEEMDRIIKKGVIFDVVLGGNDPTALGCLAAIQKNHYDHPTLIYGIDGSPDAKAMIRAGYMEGTSAQSPVSIGEVAASTAYKYLDGEEVERDIVIPVHLITNENLKEYDVAGWQ